MKTAILKTPEARFWEKVSKSESGCWCWTAAADTRGYGVFAVAPGDVRYAHRYSFEIAHGEIPSGLLICHRCDNPPCVNPEHLFAGTHFDNFHDALDKGRVRLWQNLKRHALCRVGHVLSGDNVMSNGVYRGKFGTRPKRTCKICQMAMRNRLKELQP